MAVAFEKGVEDPSQPAQEASPDLLDFDGLGVSEGAPAAGGPQVGILSWGHLTAVLDLGGQGTRLRQEGSKCPSAQVAAPYKPEDFAKDLGARLGRELAVSFYSVLHWLQHPVLHCYLFVDQSHKAKCSPTARRIGMYAAADKAHIWIANAGSSEQRCCKGWGPHELH